VRILLIEDDVELAASLRSLLERRDYSVHVAADGESGFAALSAHRFDVAIVDIVLPKRDGFSIASHARAAGIQTPILMLTARDAIEDRVRGFNAGADDYVTKPFAEDELLARLRALVRRGGMPQRGAYTVGDLVVDGGARTVAIAGRFVSLGPTEFRIVEYLAAHAPNARTKDDILAFIWGTSFEGSPNIVDVYLSTIRSKLRRFNADRRLVTVRGFGYKLIA
jgi:two-component system, OmpR family, response regulator